MTESSVQKDGSTRPNVEVVKGTLNPTQRAALEQIVDGIAESVERERNAKPDSRGHYGLPVRQPAHNTANPTGFRSNPLPRR